MKKRKKYTDKEMDKLKKIWEDKGRKRNRININGQWITFFLILTAGVIYAAYQIALYLFKTFQS